MKHIGRNSLYISVFGLILFYCLIELKVVSGWGWHIVLAGFEAATVGGIADWFAVTALFREIKLPFVRKHTNIIVKNRSKIFRVIPTDSFTSSGASNGIHSSVSAPKCPTGGSSREGAR